VTPEPLQTFFAGPAAEDKLYDRLVMVIGTPGSGKTTLARLFQYPTLAALLRSGASETHSSLIDTLAACRAITDGHPSVLGTRISLESEYREIWEFPYPADLKVGLTHTLLQARSVLGWMRAVEATGVDLRRVSIIPRAGSDAAVEAIGGLNGDGVLHRAREVELGIYRIAAALVPPSIEDIDEGVLGGYRPFDVIESISLPDHGPTDLRPLAIFDDAHRLHPDQLEALSRWLVRREMRVARWVLTRLDALSPTEVLVDALAERVEPGIMRAREVTEIWMQSVGNRTNNRRAFRSMAADMSGRYMVQMDVLRRRNLRRLPDLLEDEPSPLSPTKVSELERHVDVVQRRVRMQDGRRAELTADVESFLNARGLNSPEVRLAALSILMERYAKRTSQGALFDDDPEPSKPLRMDASVLDGARVHLLHRHDRSYYYGMDTLCDAGTENAEQFLQFAGRLVATTETQIIRGGSASLTADTQHRLLVKRSGEIVQAWDFPHHRQVRRLGDAIAGECVQRTMEPNASLGGGANAIGILAEEYEELPTRYPELARVIQFGVAYNAFVLVRDHGTKKKVWCLIELGGALSLQHGLTLRRGGFIERTARDLAKMLESG
jgi:hypothetical protein